MPPEQALFTAVIETALDDARKPFKAINADEAWSFLTSTTGNWAASREAVCTNAGIDPDWLRAITLQNITNPADVRAAAKAAKRTKSRKPAGRGAAGFTIIKNSPEN